MSTAGSASWDASLKPDPLRKGSYYRRLEDVGRALGSLQADRLPETMQFPVYFFACEKVARGLVGIHALRPATVAYGHRFPLRLGEIKVASVTLGLPIAEQDLEWLFADHSQQHPLRSLKPDAISARHLRNKLAHDFGPSHVALVAKHASFHIPKMKLFLVCVPAILAYQRLHFAAAP